MTVRLEPLIGRRVAARPNVTRFLPVVILAGYGVLIVSLYARHTLTWYINPAYVWPTTLAGVVLLGLAAVRAARAGSHTHGHEHHEHDHHVHLAHEDACSIDGCSEACGCGEGETRLWPYAVLAVPLLLALAFPPRGLAAVSALQRGPQIAGLTAIHGVSTVKRVSLTVDTKSFDMMDWVGALSADPNPKDYAGKPVQVTGMVLRDPGSVPPGYVMVLRYLVTCCIADARPVGLIVKDTSHGALHDNEWVHVTGTMGAASYAGDKIAVVEPKQIAQVKAGDPYIY